MRKEVLLCPSAAHAATAPDSSARVASRRSVAAVTRGPFQVLLADSSAFALAGPVYTFLLTPFLAESRFLEHSESSITMIQVDKGIFAFF